jgi:hypothetical protein
MPTIDRVAGFRVRFFSSDRDEPPHVHVERQAGAAKFWLQPVALDWSRGFAGHELRDAERIIRARTGLYLERWHAHFRHPDDPAGGARPGDR